MQLLIWFIFGGPQEVAGVGAIKQVQIKGQNSDWQGMNNYW